MLIGMPNHVLVKGEIPRGVSVLVISMEALKAFCEIIRIVLALLCYWQAYRNKIDDIGNMLLFASLGVLLLK